MMRCFVVLLVLLALGCAGDDAPQHPRVRVGTYAVDGLLPEGLQLLPTTSLTPTPYPMIRVAGTEDLYDVPGASDGPFRVAHPAGWASIQTQTAYPVLAMGAPPPYVHVGAPRTLYLESVHPNFRPGRTWAARIREGGDFRVARPRVEVEPGGRVVALRLDAKDAGEQLVLFGRLSRGSVERLPPGETETGPFAEPRGVTLSKDGRPSLAGVTPASAATFEVRLAAAPDDLALELTFEDLPIPYRAEGRSRSGVVRFADVPLFDLVIRLRLGNDGPVYRVTPDERRELDGIRLRLVDPRVGRRVRLAAKDGTAIRRVMASAAGGYGLLPAPVEGRFLVPGARTHLLVEGDDRWATWTLEPGVEAATDISLRRAVQVQGSIEDWNPTMRGTLRFHRHEGDERLSGHGLERRILAQGVFACDLPAGTYDVEVVSPRGSHRRQAPLELTKPGAHLHTTLRAP